MQDRETLKTRTRTLNNEGGGRAANRHDENNKHDIQCNLRSKLPISNLVPRPDSLLPAYILSRAQKRLQLSNYLNITKQRFC